MALTAPTAPGSSAARGELPSAPLEPPYELVEVDRYCVFSDGPVGYVDVVPPVFVCYLGHPFARAVEIAQVHDFQRAISAVTRAAQRS